jgi:hypothetical protein
MDINEIRDSLRDKRLAVIAEATGLHYNTLREIRDNPEPNPTYKVLKLLSSYLTNTAYNGKS